MTPEIAYPSGSVTLSIDDMSGYNSKELTGSRFRTMSSDGTYGTWKTYMPSGGPGVALTFVPQPKQIFIGFQMELHCPAFSGSGQSQMYHFYASFSWSDGYSTPPMDWAYQHYNS